MSALPARWLEPDPDIVPEATPPAETQPERDDLAEIGRRVTRRTQLHRRRAARRRLVALLVLACLLVAGVAAFVLLTRTPDRFAGVWWEPATGRRVELVARGGGYTLLYGTAKQSYTARWRGADLIVATPLGGDIVIRAKGDDRLLLKEGGRTSVLSRLPDGL